MSKQQRTCREMRGTRVLWVAAMAVLLVAQPASPEGDQNGNPTPSGVGMRIVANANVTTHTLSPREVADIFLGRKRHWDDGTRISLAILKRSELQDKFLSTYVGKTPSQYLSYWRNIVFSGSGSMPRRFATENELLGYVATEKGAVCSIANTNLTHGMDVTIISVEEGKHK